jgi:hypothetical protein
MLLNVINKILMVLFCMALLNSIRHTYYFIQAWFLSTQEEPVKYKISSKSLFLLGASIAYLITAIFTGINL